ncbi:MAG: glycerol kinase GlpK [Spirochaetia bacterium]|nr:glycerol kinase GlpK [Spirochaetia bacterium]
MQDIAQNVNHNASYFLTIDQGTSGTKALLFTREGKLSHRLDKGHQQFYPQSGWVEHDPEEIFGNTVAAMKAVMEKAGISSRDIICISISNQRETTIMWDRSTGRPVMNAVVWQCRRAEDQCRIIAEAGKGPLVKEKTGLVLSPYFSAAKAQWIIQNVPGAKEKMDAGNLLFGTVDTYIIWKLTGGTVHATDYSNAGRTQLFNIHTLEWDRELLTLFGLDPGCMPEVLSSDSFFGQTRRGLFETGIPIAGVLGDSHAAFFAQCCTVRGMAKATYGTGSSVMMNVGEEDSLFSEKVVTSIGYALKGDVTYVLEGNINCTGATIKWLVDDLELISSSKEAGILSESVDSNEGVYLVPAFVGLSAPYWNSDVRAVIANLTRGTKKAHIVRAAEESIAYQIQDVIEAMQNDSGISLRELRVDGGPTRDTFLMQFQADITQVPVVRTSIEELSATGAMYMGGLASSVWHTLKEIEQLREVERVFTPARSTEWRNRQYDGWKQAVSNLLK